MDVDVVDGEVVDEGKGEASEVRYSSMDQEQTDTDPNASQERQGPI